jgi:hypothetical protein
VLTDDEIEAEALVRTELAEARARCYEYLREHGDD